MTNDLAWIYESSRWDESVAQYHRRNQLCIGYTVDYDHGTQTTIVNVFSHHNGRTDAPLGCLRLQRDEWTVLHKHIYQRWECFDPHVVDAVEERA